MTERAGTDLEGSLDQFLHLEAAGWKGRTGTALLRRPGDTRFFREMAAGFAADGRLLVFNLEAGHRVLAQSVVLTAGSGLFGFKRAYDEAMARSSPGTLLDLDLLEWFHRAEAFTSIDTSSEPSVADRDLYGDRLALSVSVVGLGGSARHVPGLFHHVDVARARLRGTRATARATIDTLRTAVRRGARSGSGP
jgi:CelD/BcsL family acetyltransferase involved in cellulose biosynthesis